MTRNWAYIFAGLLLVFATVVIYLSVYIPAQQRALDKNSQVMGRLSVVAIKVMPSNLSDYPISFSFERASDDSGAMTSYRIQANPEAQQQIGQAIEAQLTDVSTSPTQTVGEFVDDGYSYTVLINPTDSQTTVVVIDNGLVAE